jgi:hypothetical protein
MDTYHPLKTVGIRGFWPRYARLETTHPPKVGQQQPGSTPTHPHADSEICDHNYTAPANEQGPGSSTQPARRQQQAIQRGQSRQSARQQLGQPREISSQGQEEAQACLRLSLSLPAAACVADVLGISDPFGSGLLPARSAGMCSSSGSFRHVATHGNKDGALAGGL